MKTAAADDQLIGKPMDRVDARLKVTGASDYTSDIPVANTAYAVIITSSIARGQVVSMDTASAFKIEGVMAIYTPFQAPKIARGSLAAQSAPAPQSPGSSQKPKPPDRKIHLLQETDVFYNGQPIGLAVAETLEAATEAADRVTIKYLEERPITIMARELHNAYTPSSAGGQQLNPASNKGDIDKGWSDAVHRIDCTYITRPDTHNAMEPHTTLATWQGDRLTIYDTTQGIFGVRRRISDLFALPLENVRVISHFIGGGFGSKGPVWSHVGLAVMAAQALGRPVKLELSRRQMFGNVGFRGETHQTTRLGSANDGALTLVQHDGIVQTSMYDEFIEPVGIATRMLYACPHIATTHRAVRMNSGTPSFTRAPGEASGMFALECAMDELAYAAKIDPLALRLKNYAEVDPETGHPWSSKSLRECYSRASERFGWSARTHEPRSQKIGNEYVGYGMATATYPTNRSASSAVARVYSDGHVVVQCGTQDIGTGTYTVMTQIAAETLGLPANRIEFKLGDTDLPEGAQSGGSQTAASVGSAVLLASRALVSKLCGIASADPQSSLFGISETEIVARGSCLQSKSNSDRKDTFEEILRRKRLANLEARSDAKPGDEQQKFSMHSFGAHFAEVHVDAELGAVRVTRYVGAFAAGRILNAKTARNQFMGGITWGISMALFEETRMDPRSGRILNADLAEYHVPVNADVPDIDVIFVDETDTTINPIGVKGIGEIGIVGAPAAIANAVFNATGKRVRDLPITLDKLI